MNYYIADTHFGHENVIRFDNRPFMNVGEMDKEMIKYWNACVSEKDDIYVIGDFAYRNKHDFIWYLKQLKGHKHLIVGNHDGKLLEDKAAIAYFETVSHYLEIVDDNRRIILSHYPLAEWNGYHRESFHIYGHIHNKTDGAFQYMKKMERAINAAVCINNYVPCTLSELIANNQIFKMLS